MGQGGGCASFATEPLPRCGIRTDIPRHPLERDAACQPHVICEVHDAHAPAPDLMVYEVRPDGPSGGIGS
jgi:hypothetical protein